MTAARERRSKSSPRGPRAGDHRAGPTQRAAPRADRAARAVTPTVRLRRCSTPTSRSRIMPLFALANAGVAIDGSSFAARSYSRSSQA
ncbi:MAG: Na+/H+ antiporter NhaA [Polyangiaceae bacterium]|nr:Na+/H+ antiporter NhaA [Polyangiaceae bacterium]